MSLADQKSIHLLLGPFEAVIAPLGANLVRFRRHGRDLILGLRDISAHVSNDFYAGTIVGPIANRISKGKVEIDGQTFQMELNEAGKTALHSGTDGLHTLTWDIVSTRSSSVALACQLPDGYSGLPGHRDISVLYVLDETGLTVTIEATTDKKTPINISHHPYWALEPDQSTTKLMVNAPTYLPIDTHGLPTGEQRSVVDSPFDFTKLRSIGTDASLDHNWCVGTKRSETPRPIATLTAQDGLQLEIHSTEVGLQVYTGSGLPTFAPTLSEGPQIKPNTGIALEPQGWPDAPNNSTFPSILLDTGEVYRQITRYIFTQNQK